MSGLFKLLYALLLMLAIIVIMVELFTRRASRLSVLKPDKHLLIAGIIEMLGSALSTILGEVLMKPYTVSKVLNYGMITFVCLFVIGLINTVRYIDDWTESVNYSATSYRASCFSHHCTGYDIT